MRTIRFRLIPRAAGALGLLAAMAGAAPAEEKPAPADMKAEARALVAACRSDFSRLCPGVQTGGGQVLACLQGHVSELKPQCRDMLPKAEALKWRAEAGTTPR